MAKPGYPRYITHGERKSGAYSSWAAMKSRCSNPKNSGYERYGGRGITVCERWNVFENFLADMGHRPAGYTIDRIDGSGNYEPSNCRWAGKLQQASNRSSCIILEHDGISDTMAGWARRIGCDEESLSVRIKSGWPVFQALTEPFSRNTPSRKTQRIECDGKSLTAQQWSAISGIGDDTIRWRIKIGWEPREAIYAPPRSKPKTRKRKIQ